jgi:two-component system, NarL family, sensor histidine kinase UhpB
VVLTVRDNGIGLPANAARQPGSYGLVGMRERCQMLGGRFEIGNAPGGGVGVTVRLPLAAGPHDETRSERT